MNFNMELQEIVNEAFASLRKSIIEEMSDKLKEAWEKETDYKTKSGLYQAYDIINGAI